MVGQSKNMRLNWGPPLKRAFEWWATTKICVEWCATHKMNVLIVRHP